LSSPFSPQFRRRFQEKQSFYLTPELLPPPHELWEGNWLIKADDADASTMEIEISKDLGVGDQSPVFVILPGCGLCLDTLRKLYGKAPVEAWWIACNCGDRDTAAKGRAFTRKLSPCVVQVLEWLKQQQQQGGTMALRKIFIICFSRGARWGIHLCLQHAKLFDGAVILAGYPETKGVDQQEQEAKALMQVPMPILMLHGLDDPLCGPAKYVRWHLSFELAMKMQVARQYGSRLESFASFTVKGDHDVIQALFENLGFQELSNPQIDGFWRAMLSAGSASPEAVQVSAGSASPEPVQAPPTEPAQASAPRPFESWAWACML
jgi:hypothetical protein